MNRQAALTARSASQRRGGSATTVSTNSRVMLPVGHDVERSMHSCYAAIRPAGQAPHRRRKIQRSHHLPAASPLGVAIPWTSIFRRSISGGERGRTLVEERNTLRIGERHRTPVVREKSCGSQSDTSCQAVGMEKRGGSRQIAGGEDHTVSPEDRRVKTRTPLDTEPEMRRCSEGRGRLEPERASPRHSQGRPSRHGRRTAAANRTSVAARAAMAASPPLPVVPRHQRWGGCFWEWDKSSGTTVRESEEITGIRLLVTGARQVENRRENGQRAVIPQSAS